MGSVGAPRLWRRQNLVGHHETNTVSTNGEVGVLMEWRQRIHREEVS